MLPCAGPSQCAMVRSRRKCQCRSDAELLLDGIDIPEHPDISDLAAIRRKKRRADPFDIVAGRGRTEEGASMSATKAHTCGGPVIRLDQVIDDAPVVRQTGVNRAHVIDEPFRPGPHRPKRRLEAKIGVQNLTRDSFVRLVPDLVIEALNQTTCSYLHVPPPKLRACLKAPFVHHRQSRNPTSAVRHCPRERVFMPQLPSLTAEIH